MIGHVDTPSNGQPTIGRPFYGQAKGQLRLTCAFYAECAHEGSEGVVAARAANIKRAPKAPEPSYFREYSPTSILALKNAPFGAFFLVDIRIHP